MPNNNKTIILAEMAPHMKQSQGLPHEAFHVATKPALNLDRKLSGATIGYNVAVANDSLRYNLRLP